MFLPVFFFLASSVAAFLELPGSVPDLRDLYVLPRVFFLVDCSGRMPLPYVLFGLIPCTVFFLVPSSDPVILLVYSVFASRLLIFVF